LRDFGDDGMAFLAPREGMAIEQAYERNDCSE
jgi:hypothetical protein